MIAGADPAPLRAYADALGLAFQIADDILDVTGDVNSIVLALPRKTAINREALAGMAGNVARARQFRVNLADLVRQAYQEIPSLKLDGAVLRDRDIKVAP